LTLIDLHVQAIKLYEDAERASRENMELRYAQEKSKVDTRMGRSVCHCAYPQIQYG
jgi:hypothetical protein